MLRYFINNKDIMQISEICDKLNEIKLHISNSEYNNFDDIFDKCLILFKQVKEFAINQNNENLANSQYVFQQYFLLFCNLSKYFNMLKDRNYKNSWYTLQDCFDSIKYVGKFTNDRLDIPDIYNLLLSYEKLYPYNIFASSEYVIGQSHCSICGNSMQDLSCPHIRGNLYWGEPAIEIIDDIQEFQAVAIVSHPEDKRCVLEISNNLTDAEKYQKISQFLDLKLPFLQFFSIETIKEIRKNKNLPNLSRNSRCYCGSGKKFKKCCGKDIYYKYEKNIVLPGDYLNFIFV